MKFWVLAWLSVIASLPASAGSVAISWSVPTTNVDGTALTDLAGYRVYYGPSATSLTQTVTISNPGIRSYILDNLPAGPVFMAMTAFNSAGTESAQTSLVTTTVVSASLLTLGPYSYEPTGTATAPTMSAIGLVDSGLPCGPETRLVGTTKFCQIQRSQTDLIGWPVDKKLSGGLWAKAAP